MKMLFVGAHPDDIEMGAGGLLASMAGRAECRVLVMADCEEQPGNRGITKEFRRSMDILGVEGYELAGIPNTEFPSHSARIRKALEDVRDSFKPDIVITHCIKNLHQDHRTVAQECLRAFRNTSILMYEDVKSTPNFVPSLIVSLSEEDLKRKLDAVHSYKTQERRYYYNDDFLSTLARFRGMRMNVRYGEGFEVYQFLYGNRGGKEEGLGKFIVKGG